MTTPLTRHEIAVLSAIFARSNLGHGRPNKCSVDVAMRNTCNNDFVVFFCAEFMESEHHEEIFQKEANGWADYLTKRRLNNREYVQQYHPEIADLMWGKPNADHNASMPNVRRSRG